MKLSRGSFPARPNFVKKEKYGIGLIVLIALADAVAIYYLLSLEEVKSGGVLAGLSEMAQQYIACSGNWLKASVINADRVRLIYLLGVISIFFSSIVVIATTPSKQLSLWAIDVDVKHAVFHVFVYGAGLYFLMCYVGNYAAIGDVRESSRFRFLFNSYLGFVWVVGVAANVLAYYATLSILLLVAMAKKS